MKSIEKLFRKAAVTIDRHHQACCITISLSAKCLADRELAKYGFIKAFRPINWSNYDYWFGHPYGDTKDILKLRKQHRVFAMLIMAELAKDQGV